MQVQKELARAKFRINTKGLVPQIAVGDVRAVASRIFRSYGGRREGEA